MDNVTKKVIEENCILKANKIKEQGYSEEYIQGYIRAYIDGFEDGNIFGMKKIKEIIQKS